MYSQPFTPSVKPSIPGPAGAAGAMPVYDSYFDLVSANPSDGIGFVSGLGLFQKWEGRWIPSNNTANHKLFQFSIDYVGKGNQRPPPSALSGTFVNIAPIPMLGKILAISPVGPNHICYSNNGDIWVNGVIPSASWRCVAPSINNGWVYAFNTDLPLNRAAISYDGVNWSLQNTPATADIVWREACWDPGHDRVVAVGYGSTTQNNAMFNQDTAGWNSGTTANNNDLLSVCYDSKRNRLVAVGNVGGLDRCQISTNGGSTWTTRDMPSASVWVKVIYSEIADRLFAVSAGGLHAAAYSDDGGDTWTPISNLYGLSIRSICEITDWCRIVILCVNGDMYYSDDYGATWVYNIGGARVGDAYAMGYNPTLKNLLTCGLSAPYISKTAGIYL